VLLAQDLSDRLLDPPLGRLGIETSIGVCAEAVDAPVADVGHEAHAHLILPEGADLVWERFEMASLPAVSGRVYLSASLAKLGDFTAAARASEEALAIAVAADHPYSVAHAWNGLGRRSAMQGNFREAIPWLDTCPLDFSRPPPVGGTMPGGN
jgi:hypothetical protein